MHFLALIEIDEARLAEIGGKAANLHMLHTMKQPVPPWIVIPKTALEKIVTGSISLEEIKKRIDEYRIPRGFLDEVQCYFKGYSYLAVRSSAVDEDSAALSFAGQFESYLYVTPQELETSIKKVWLSAYSERVVAYRKQSNLPPQQGMAVVIQAMVDADVSGVGFGIDPVSGDTRAKVISAVYGLGEGLVSGELDADTWLLKENKVMARLVDKAYRMIKNGAGGLRKAEVSDALRNKPALDESQLKKISAVLEDLANATGKPQDIEFAIKDGELFLLQARPVTTANKKPDREDNYIVWDNSNIVESYPGVTTPLTFSFILPVYEAVYRQLSRVLGVSENDIEKHAHVYANMLGLIQGRVYYNLLSWYKLLSLLPGYSLNAEFMEKMMGVKERFELKDLPKHTRFVEQLRVAKMVFVMLRNLVSLPKQRRNFVRDFNRVIERYEKIDFDKAQPEELVSYYLDFEQTLIKKWKAPLVNDFFAMIYFGTLQKMIARLNIKDAANLQNDLLCGANDIISTQPAKLSLSINEEICKNEEAKAFFQTHTEEEILLALEQGKFPGIRMLIDNYIGRFGDRRVGELKLETITYKQNSAAFIRHIKGLVSQNILQRGYEKRNEREVRAHAEQMLRDALKGKPFKRMLFAHVLKKTRSLVSNRENLRYERTRAFGVVRRFFLALGKHFHKAEILDESRDIFYLIKGEIFAFIEGTSVTVSLKDLVALRKREFSEYEKKTPAERIVTWGMVYYENSFHTDAATQTPLTGDLKGLGCCPGRVKAKVRVVMNPDEVASLDGDILVTASTDPGWVILFPTASAILVERGSLLSHSAIVSREMGIPCIVGITGLLNTVKTGDIVEMDGATGELKIVSKTQAA